MAVVSRQAESERITFWLGCHVLRHSDIIRSCVGLLEALEIDVRTAGGPRYCCGTIKDMNIVAADTLGRNTAKRFNSLKRDVLVSYCPSCQSHMDNVVSQAHDTEFNSLHFVSFLHARRDQLAKLLTRPLQRRVAIHQHAGFQSRFPINEMVRELLEMVPALEVVPHGITVPGMHCTTALVAVPKMRDDLVASLKKLKVECDIDQVVTIFHSCQRQLCGYESACQAEIVNFVKLLSESAGLATEADIYKSWKSAETDEDARSHVGEDLIEEVGEARFSKLILPELLKP